MGQKIRIHRQDYMDSFDVDIWESLPDGQIYHGKPIQWTHTEPRGTRTEPTFRMDSVNGRVTLQELFNDLWSLGFRPVQTFPDSAGIVTAKDEHIKDLRRVIWKDDK